MTSRHVAGRRSRAVICAWRNENRVRRAGLQPRLAPLKGALLDATSRTGPRAESQEPEAKNMASYQPVLTPHVREPNSFTLDAYVKQARGYEGLKKALTMKPGDVNV